MVKPALAVSAAARLPALLAARDWAGAERVLRAEAKRKNAPCAVFYNLAKVLIESGKAAQAGAWFERAVRTDPTYQAAWFELGRWAMARGEAARARDAFARAVLLAPEDLDAHANLARLALRLGDWAGALEAAQAVLAQTPDRADMLEVAYRAAAETRDPAAQTYRARLYDVSGGGALWLRAVTRVAKGHVSLR